MRRNSSCRRVGELAVTVLMLLLWLGGCGPNSVSRLRKMPDRVYSFDVPADCVTVYERIARRAREQYGFVNQGIYQHGVTAQLFPSRQAAAVSLADTGGLSLQYRLHADLRALDPTHTQVDIYCGTARYQPAAQLWREWAYSPLGE